MKKFEYTSGIGDTNGNRYIVLPDHENDIVYYGQYWGMASHISPHPTRWADTVKKDLKRELNGFIRMGYKQVGAEEFKDINNLV